MVTVEESAGTSKAIWVEPPPKSKEPIVLIILSFSGGRERKRKVVHLILTMTMYLLFTHRWLVEILLKIVSGYPSCNCLLLSSDDLGITIIKLIVRAVERLANCLQDLITNCLVCHAKKNVQVYSVAMKLLSLSLSSLSSLLQFLPKPCS